MASMPGISSYYAMYGSTYSASNMYGIDPSASIYKYFTQNNKTQTQSSTQFGALSGDQTKSYLSSLKSYGNSLKNATNTLANQSLFSRVSGYASDEEALSVSVAKQDDAAKLDTTKDVAIQRLAASQQNTGNTTAATAISGANNGNNTFTVEKDGKSYQFNVRINATDSTRTAQQKTADAINNSQIGITASVTYDEKTKQSTLVLTSKDTGEANAFEIKDEAGSNLITALGADKTTREAADAQYTIDGVAKQSATNTVDLGDGLTGTFKKVTTDTVEAGTKRDITGITNAIYDVVNNFNGLLDTAKTYNDDKGAQGLQQRLDTIAASYENSLAQIGITRNKDGYLEVDTEKLQTAFEQGSAERHLGNTSAGFTQRLSQLAQSVDANPDRFVSYQSRNNANITSTDNGYTDFLSSYRSANLVVASYLFDTGV